MPTKVSGSFISAARGGILTNYVIARPPGQIAPLRPVIALHGVRGSAKQVMSFGVEQVLADLVTAGRPPFAVVAVDGGDSYWHRRAGGEDAGSMVLNELIPMLSTMNLDITRVGFIGWSMGGYGAMLLGARLGPARTAGICAVSPALYQSYTASTLGAFDSYDDWTHNTVFGSPALSTIPLRIDCGNDDQLRPGHAPVHRPAAHAARRWLLARWTRRGVLASAAARRARLAVIPKLFEPQAVSHHE